MGRIAYIISIVCKEYGVSRTELLSISRAQRLVRPRHIAMYLVSEHTKLSQAQTAAKFNRERTSYLHGIKKIEEEMPCDRGLYARVSRLRWLIDIEKAKRGWI